MPPPDAPPPPRRKGAGGQTDQATDRVTSDGSPLGCYVEDHGTSVDSYDVAITRLVEVVDDDARCLAQYRIERAYRCLTVGGRLDLAAEDLRWAAERLTTGVDRQLTTAVGVLESPTLGAVRRLTGSEAAA